MSIAKRNALLMLAIAGLLILLLAMGLPGVVLLPAQPFSLEKLSQGTSGANGLLPGGEILILLFRGVMALTLIFLPVYIIYSLFSKEGRKRLLFNAVILILALIVSDYLRNLTPNPEPEQPEQVNLLQNGDQIEPGVPPTIFSPDPPPWLTVTIILVVSALAAACVIIVMWMLRRRAEKPDFSLERLAEEAQSAIEAIHGGGDFRATIIGCYQEMSRVLKEEKGIARETTMTPREFESQLVSRGFPRDAIQTLTRLFEQARYGSIAASADEERTALTCLNDIVGASKVIGN